MLLRTLRDCPFLQSISVDDTNSKMHIPHSSAEWKELENEVASSIPMELNGIMFGANVDDKNKVYEGERFLQLLHLLCIRLTQSAAASTVDKHNNNNRMNPDDLYKALLVRLSPKNGTSTGYSLVNRLIGSKELVVQVPKKPIRPVSRPSLVIYASGSNIHAIVDHHQTYGLYRKSDAAGKPWIGLTTIYHERVNLSSGKSVRRVNVQVHEEKFSPY